MRRPRTGDPHGAIYDRGSDGWCCAVELVDPRDLERRVGSILNWMGSVWRIIGVSKLRPAHDGVVVRLKLAHRSLDTAPRLE